MDHTLNQLITINQTSKTKIDEKCFLILYSIKSYPNKKELHKVIENAIAQIGDFETFKELSDQELKDSFNLNQIQLLTFKKTFLNVDHLKETYNNLAKDEETLKKHFFN